MMTPDDIDVWVRLDVGKGAHALDRDGDTLYDKPLKQDEKAIRSMLEHLSRRGRVLLVVDQPNTIGSLPLTVARDMGIAVAYLPSTAMLRTAQLPPETLRDAGLDDETLAALKLLIGHDEDLAHESTRYVNRLRSLLLQTHPAFERALKGERITREATLALLERYGGPAGMKRAGVEDVKDWAKSNGLRAGRIIDDMFKAIGEQTVTVPGTGMAETIIPSIARDIKAIKDRRREVGRQVGKLLEDHPLLTVPASMPGIGVRTASSILLGIGGDIANFKSAAHLAAYAGIAPVTGQSGTSIKGERPSRRGNKRLKNALWQSSFVASTKHPPSIAYYKRKREQGPALAA